MEEPKQPARAKRKYEHVWERLINNPEKTVKIKVNKAEILQRVRKAVWKEKDLCDRRTESGTLKKKLYRLTTEIIEKDLTILFKLEPTLHVENL
jgi:hypothetical protein